MKILICSTSGALGGMERRIEAEAQLLTSLGHEVLVASTRFPELEIWKTDVRKTGARYFDWCPYKFIERGHFAPPLRWLALATLHSLRREKIDMAHLAIPWNFVGMSMAYVLHKANIPFVVSVHCKLGNRTLPRRGRDAVSEAMHSLVGGYAVSSSVNDSFVRLYQDMVSPTAHIETILNGIDIQRFRPDAVLRPSVRRNLGFEDGHFVVIFCGRIDPMKRPLFAVRAFAKFVARYPMGRLLIVGHGPEQAAVKLEITSLGIEDKVIMTGQVADTAPYYAASDCYLSTSANQEGCPLAAAEALATGLPAVLPEDDVFGSVYGACEAVQQCATASHDGWDDALLSIALLDQASKYLLSDMAQQYVKMTLSKQIMNGCLTAFYEKVFSKLGNDN